MHRSLSAPFWTVNFSVRIFKSILSDVSNIESKWRRTEEENSKLKEQLAGLRDKDRRNREPLTHDVEDTENRLRQTDNRLRDSDHRLRETEDRLNDSQRENDRLHDKIQGNVRFFEKFSTKIGLKVSVKNGPIYFGKDLFLDGPSTLT